jgi:hypothetical protein
MTKQQYAAKTNRPLRNIGAAINRASVPYLKGKRRTSVGDALIQAIGGVRQ